MKSYILLLAAFFCSFALFAQTFQASEKVDVYAVDGKMYKATVLAVDGDKYRIRYDGYDATYDVWLTAAQLQKVPVVGGAVEVYATDGKWYKATILEAAGEQYKVRYEGYNDFNDTWLKREHFRTVPPVASSAQPATQAATKAKNVAVKTTEMKRPDEAAVKQTYGSTAGKLYLRTMGRMWGSSYSLDINWVYLGADGTIVYDPVSGVDPIDYKSEELSNSKNIGKYKLAGKKMFITWRSGKTDEWSVETKGTEMSVLNGGIVTRQDRMPADYRIEGKYASGAVTPNLGSFSTFVFSKDGTFTLNNLGTVSTADVSAQKEWGSGGTYSITGNTLTLQFANGEKKKSVICIWNMGDGKKSLVINGRYFPQER